MKKLLITDVDGTLTKKSLVLSHCGYLIKEGIIKDDGSYKAWEKDIKNEELIVAVAGNYRKSIIGKTIESLKPSEFINSFLSSKLENWYSTLRELFHASETNYFDDIYLITGSSDFLVKILAKKLGVKYFATKYFLDENNRLTGEIKGMFSADQKDDCIQCNINPNEYQYIEGWGDTLSDCGIFKYCNYKILVDPTKQTLENMPLDINIDKIIEE